VGARRANKVGEEAAVAPLFRAASEGGAGPARRRVLLRITTQILTRPCSEPPCAVLRSAVSVWAGHLHLPRL
jgi:hypothetical protein